MSIYDSIDNMWEHLLFVLLNCANNRDSRDGPVCGEVVGYKGVLDASKQRTFLTNDVRNLSPSYAAAEFLWYMSGEGSTEMIEKYAPSYVKYRRQDGTAYGAYGPRMFAAWDVTTDFSGTSQVPDDRPALERIVDMLRKSSLSRQAVLQFWDPHDLSVAESGGCADVPCTLGLQFLARDGALHIVTTMRSNDAWLGFPYDVFAFTCLQRVVACELGLQVGEYHHQVGSMHLYARNETRAREALASGTSTEVPHGWQLDDTLDSVKLAVELESLLRHGGNPLEVEARAQALGGMGTDLLRACCNKLRPALEWSPRSPLMQRRSNACTDAK